ncbi:MAG: type IV toxin-antitoxin system AbiEi family antitoxin domain-containing protein [Nitrososphaerota archaeon]|nr:type IV toxin-antitoxin system AbiEi family antitoxin domain-containing protein [Nitrososphaerota archaeon]MDG7051910.1 type IV toxin-antitoxin system AbiEi family antitoxin domain-containing protein [Nitrososphaerota archaeon]
MKVDDIRGIAKENPYFTISDVKRVAGQRYAYLIINKLMKRGEIFRLGRGVYSRYSDPSLAVYYFKPAYIGLQDAMSYHNLWEQETVPIIITCRKVRRVERTVFKTRMVVKAISPNYFFGYEFIETGDFSVPVSDVEKTLIDLIYFREWVKDYGKLFSGKVDLNRLNEYLERYSPRLRKTIDKLDLKRNL